MTKKRTPHNEDYFVKFVNLWQSSSSVEEMSRKLGVSVQLIRDVATKCKKNGIKLKNFGRNTKKIDWETIKLRLELTKSQNGAVNTR